MSMGKKLGFLLLLLAVAAVSEMAAPGVEAAECLVPSGSFHGPCINSGHCANKCRGEGYADGGRCSGIYLMCLCRKPCATTAA